MYVCPVIFLTFILPVAQEAISVDEQEVLPKTKKKKQRSTRHVAYTIPDIPGSNAHITVTKPSGRLTFTDVRSQDPPSGSILEKGLYLGPYYLATSDPFPDRNVSSNDAFCASLFTHALDDILAELAQQSNLDSTEPTGDHAEHVQSSHEQLQARQEAYNDLLDTKYRTEINRLVCFLQTM